MCEKNVYFCCVSISPQPLKLPKYMYNIYNLETLCTVLGNILVSIRGGYGSLIFHSPLLF